MHTSHAARSVSGVTLVDLMVTSVMLVLIGGIFVTLLQTGNRAWLSVDRQLASVTDAQRALDRMTADLQQASSGSGTGLCGTAAPTCASTSSSTTLSLCLAGTGATVQYTFSNSTSTLTRTVNAGAATTIGTGITNLTLSCPAPSITPKVITVAVTVSTSYQLVASQRSPNAVSQVWVVSP